MTSCYKSDYCYDENKVPSYEFINKGDDMKVNCDD